MTLTKLLRIIPGLLVLVALALGLPQSPGFVAAPWLWLAVFVAFMQFQSGFTQICPLEMGLRKLGMSDPA